MGYLPDYPFSNVDNDKQFEPFMFIAEYAENDEFDLVTILFSTLFSFYNDSHVYVSLFTFPFSDPSSL